MKHILTLLTALVLTPLAWAAVTNDDVLLFSFFRGNGEAGTYLAWSEDGVKFAALNDDKPIFPPAPWPGQNLTRDPSIIYRDGKFRAVWTSSWKGRVFAYAESPDLVRWSEPVKVQPFPDSLPAEDQPQNVWAPEIHWDPAQKNYAILFSSTMERESRDGDGSSNNGKDGGNDHRIYVTRTADGKTFSPAKLFFDQGFSVIDAQMAPDGGRWVMAIKHEQEIPLSGKNLRLTFAPLDLSKPWSPASVPVFGPGSPIRPKEMVEGACLVKWNGLWHLYTDAFANRHYSMATSPDLKTWTDCTDELVMPPNNPRHGTIFRAPRSAVGFLKSVPIQRPAMYFGDSTRLGRPFAKDPCVIRFGGRYLLYYSTAPWAKELAPPDAPRGWAIGIAESRDLVNWKKVGEILPAQECDKNGLCAPGAIVLDGKVHLFYQTYGNGPLDAICHAVSDDGLRFTRDPSNPVFRPSGAWTAGRAIDAEVIEHGDRLLLYFATRDPAMKVQMLGVAAADRRSDFGRAAWKQLCDTPILKPELPWEKKCIEAASVIRRGDTLFMFYAGGYNNEPQQIGVASSKDGVKWQRLSNEPLLPNGPPGSWNSSESGHPGVFVDEDGQIYLFYQGNNDKGRTWFLSCVKIAWDGDTFKTQPPMRLNAGSLIEPVRLATIELGGFWKQQAKRLTEHWLPHCIRQMEKGGRGQEFMNLVALGRVQRGEPADWKYTGAPWSDAYVYNTMEAVCLALAVNAADDADLARAQTQLRAKLDEWIPIILAAQAPDGYIHSFHVLNKHPRYSNVGWHEFYVMGYFLEMGVAHYRMSGGKDRRLYDAAVRCGDHLCATFGPAPKRTWRNGHPGMEYALCRLGRLVNEVEGAGKGDKYIQLARHFLDHQHEVGKPDAYNQSDKPPAEMSEALGHAVRATYFYTAMTDIALHQRDAAYQQAVGRIWTNAIHKKHYLTGGVGASHKGEAFAGDYELPNDGYCEVCAGCGLTFWAERMHRLHADGHYRDVQERALYNNVLGAVELSGTKFYYQNPLDEKRGRYPWHGCPCCVGNIPRALFAIKDLIYSVNPARTELYLSHYVDSEAALPDVGGTTLRIRQTTRYPWEGNVKVTLHPARTTDFTLKLRIPNRTESELYSAAPNLAGQFTVRVNGQSQSPKIERGYIALHREWKDGDRIELSLPMEIQRVKADSRIAANVGRVALQYGPLVYNVESVDLPPSKNLDALALAADAPLRAQWDDKLLGGVLAIRGAFADGTPLQAIPNYARTNRLPQPKSQWVHLANTYDGTTQRVYVNGRLAKSRNPGPLKIADTPLTIGSDPFGQKRHFKGTIAKPAIFNAALDEKSIAQLAAAKPDSAALGVETKPVFAGKIYTLDGTAPVVTPQNIGIAGNAPWTMSVWVKTDVDAWSADSFGMGIVGWGKSGRNAGNFLYYRPEGEAVFGFYSNDDRASAGASAAIRSIVWLQEQKQGGR